MEWWYIIISNNMIDSLEKARAQLLCHHNCVFGLFPARMREISSPRLKAWLNRRRVWNVDTKGNHDNITIGVNTRIPIPASYNLAIAETDFHNPSLFTTDFHAIAIHRIAQPVGTNAKILAKRSVTVKGETATATVCRYSCQHSHFWGLQQPSRVHLHRLTERSATAHKFRRIYAP